MMSVNEKISSLYYFFLLLTYLGVSASANAEEILPEKAVVPVTPKQLVVMIESVSAEEEPIFGTGLIIGETDNGNLLIAVARKMVYKNGYLYKSKVKFHHDPGQEIDAKLVKYDFGKDVDLALLEAKPSATFNPSLTNSVAVARLQAPFKTGENCTFFVYPDEHLRGATSPLSEIVDESGHMLVVKSTKKSADISYGVAVDSSNRIIGLSLKHDPPYTPVFKLAAIKRYVEASGFSFSLSHRNQAEDIDSNYEQRLRTALTSGRWDLLQQFEPSQELVPVVNHILNDPKTVASFLSQAQSSSAIEWFGNVIQNGLDPNRIIQLPDGSKKGFLSGALAANNFPAASELLKQGASPYPYEILLGEKYATSRFLFPSNWLDSLSISDADKEKLLRLMFKAGLARVFPEMPQSVTANQDKRDQNFIKNKILSRLGHIIPNQIALGGDADKIICKAAMRYSKYDWCQQLKNIPQSIDVTDDGPLDKEFTNARIMKLLAIVDDEMYVLTHSPQAGWTKAGYGYMQIAPNVEKIIWYRFMGSSKRHVLMRDPGKNYFYVEGYHDVHFKADWPGQAPTLSEPKKKKSPPEKAVTQKKHSTNWEMQLNLSKQNQIYLRATPARIDENCDFADDSQNVIRCTMKIYHGFTQRILTADVNYRTDLAGHSLIGIDADKSTVNGSFSPKFDINELFRTLKKVSEPHKMKMLEEANEQGFESFRDYTRSRQEDYKIRNAKQQITRAIANTYGSKLPIDGIYRLDKTPQDSLIQTSCVLLPTSGEDKPVFSVDLKESYRAICIADEYSFKQVKITTTVRIHALYGGQLQEASFSNSKEIAEGPGTYFNFEFDNIREMFKRKESGHNYYLK